MNITLNNEIISVTSDMTILDVARANGINIPTLCHLDMASIKMVNQVGTCRICMVEVAGRPSLMPACTTKVWDGMVITTNTAKAINARRTVLELFLSNHPKDCLSCERNKQCELQTLAADLNVREDRFSGKMLKSQLDTTSESIIRDPEKCVLCRRCETMCNDVQTVGVYSPVNRSFESTMGTAFDNSLLDTACTFCGQCVSVCPVGALVQKGNATDVWDALNDPDKIVIVQTAPAVRVALGEEFGMPVGSRVTGKMVTALKRLGFDHVYDTSFGADLTVMEEAKELIDRVQNNGTLPILTSCCPAWVKFIEHQFPELLDIPSTCKSPMEMFGAIARTYLADKLGLDHKKIVSVAVMPCLAKKYEAARPELGHQEKPDVDYVITTRELASMCREAGINFTALPDNDFDKIMGESTGAGVVFGTTGGVIEAACRAAAHILGGDTHQKVDFEELRGFDGIREATVQAGPQELKIGIAHGLGNARTLLENIRDGKCQYHAIEIMACPGGCVGGGGQPYAGHDFDIVAERSKALRSEDSSKSRRRSFENEEIQMLYKEFLGEPGSHKAHELLHTKFTKRDKM